MIAFHDRGSSRPIRNRCDTVYPELNDTIFALAAFDAFAAFARDAGCDADPIPVAIRDNVTRHDYPGCEDDTPMSFYETTGNGHTWPGTASEKTQDVDATIESWNFFAQHSRAPVDD